MSLDPDSSRAISLRNPMVSRETMAALALTILAAALRFWRLGDWGFDSDETFTLRDSLNPRLSNPRPLLYFLNHYVVRPLVPLDELGLRLLPALFGALAVPVFYLVARRLAGPRAALFGALLLAASPLHVYYSQFARYWSLVFLLCCVYPYALYVGLRERNRGMLILGIAVGVVATLAHPTSVLLLGGLTVWLVLIYGRMDDLGRLWRRRGVRWAAGLAVLAAAAIAARFLPMLQMWISSHDRGLGSEFLLHTPGRAGTKQLAYLLGYVESLTLPLVLTALLGIYLLWRGRDRPLALFLTCLLAFPVFFLVLLSFRTPVSTFYLVPPIPALFLGAGIFLDRLTAWEWELRPSWLLPAALAAIIVAAGAPTLLSQYRDGRRYDLRSAARWLGERLTPGDVVFADQPKVINHYLPAANARYLRGDPTPLLQSLRETARAKALWVISPAPAHAFRTNPKLGSLRAWIYEHCQLRNTIGVGRMDFRQYHLQLFRCPPAAPPQGAVVTSE